jgi:hypothetical protein
VAVHYAKLSMRRFIRCVHYCMSSAEASSNIERVWSNIIELLNHEIFGNIMQFRLSLGLEPNAVKDVKITNF